MTITSRFQTDTSGSISVLFGGTALVALLIVGMAVDYSRISSERSRIDAALDAASLAGVRAATTQTIKTGGGAVNVGATKTMAQNVAADVFKAAMANDKTNTTISPSFTIAYDAKSTEWTSTATYSAKIPVIFGGLIGKTKFEATGKSVSSESTGGTVYMDLQMLLDVSSSMGIGATDADITKMVGLNGCAFGCHVGAYKATYYDLPKANGVKMRIDVLRESTKNLIDVAKVAANGKGNIRFGVDTFNDKLTTLSAMTSDLDTVKTTVDAIDLPTYDDATDIKGALIATNGKMTASGSGSTPASPRKFLFIVTDGVEDQIYMNAGTTFESEETTGSWGNTGSMRPMYCSPIKSKGITIAVIYTTYYKFSGWQYTSLVQPFDSKIATKLKSCASTGFYWEAKSADEINTAMKEMFDKSLKSVQAHLTN